MLPIPATPDFLYGTAWKEDRTAELTLAALRAGFRGIDTANQRRHYYEAGVGEALAQAYREGIVARQDLFLQTKFTYRGGQDDRLPYDPTASLSDQVSQSFVNSLEHLGTDYLDSYVLHGPSVRYGWSEADSEVWHAMQREQDAGRTRLLGVSNVSLENLKAMDEVPAFVQNRCFARLGWDYEVRGFCRERGIAYQGFSLLTANREVWTHPLVEEIAGHMNATPAQLIFAFSRKIGILPLTGTSDPAHMQKDLASLAIQLPAEAVQTLEFLAS